MNEFDEIDGQSTDLDDIVRSLDDEGEPTSSAEEPSLPVEEPSVPEEESDLPAEEPASAEPEPSVAEEEPVSTAVQSEQVGSDTGARAEAGALEPARLVRWPFAVQCALWMVFAGVLGWQLLSVDRVTPVMELEFYGWAVWAGVALTALAVPVILVAWLLSRRRGTDRRGLFTQAMALGALTALFGAVVWWGVLIAADYARFGTWL